MNAPAIEGYAVDRLLGEGAYGRVFLAHETDGLRRPVALKVFSREAREAFDRELELSRRIEELRRRTRAVSLLQALGSGESEAGPYLALEYLEQGSLAETVARDGPLDPARAAAAVRDAGDALALLHQEGLLHRDVKPANLLLGADGRVRLGDFGLAKNLSGTLSAAGSPAFAAPEVIAGRPADGRRADVYSLGATFAFLVTGETILPGRPDAFALERKGVPRAVQTLILEACATEASERPADGQAFVARLVAALEEKPRTRSAAPDGPSVEAAGRPREEDTVENVESPAPWTRADTIAAVTPRTSRAAIASLTLALLFWPLLFGVGAAMAMVTTRERSAANARFEAGAGARRELDRGRETPRVEAADDSSRVTDPSRGRDGGNGQAVLFVGLPLLVLAIVDLLAILFGATALGRIRRSGGALTGRGLALSGLVIGIVNAVIPTLLVVVFLFYSLKR